MKQEDLKNLSKLFLLFAGVCFVTSFFMNTGGDYIHAVVPQKGDKPEVKQVKGNYKLTYKPLGPVEIEDENTVVEFDVFQQIPLNHWSHVSVNLLNKNKEYITGFGDGFWHEDGYDAEGYYWEESKQNYDMKMTIPDPGKYYFQIKAERSYLNGKQQYQRVQLDVTGKQGSSLPFTIAAVVFLIAGFITFMIANKKALQENMQEFD